LGLHTKFFVRYLKGKFHLKVLSMDGNITNNNQINLKGMRQEFAEWVCTTAGKVRWRKYFECNKLLASKKLDTIFLTWAACSLVRFLLNGTNCDACFLSVAVSALTRNKVFT